MPQPENPTTPKPNKDEIDGIAGGLGEKGSSKKAQVPKPQADKADLKIHITVPIDKSMAKLKAHRKPRKNKKIIEEDTKNAKDKNNAGGGPDSRTSPDAGRGSGKSKLGSIFPVDWFRKS